MTLYQLLREKQGAIPDSTFSKTLGFAPNYWFFIKKGKRGISLDFLRAVARVYPDLRGAVVDYFLGEASPGDPELVPSGGEASGSTQCLTGEKQRQGQVTTPGEPVAPDLSIGAGGFEKPGCSMHDWTIPPPTPEKEASPDPNKQGPDKPGGPDGGTVKDEPGTRPGETAQTPNNMEPPDTPEAADLNQSATLTSAGSNQGVPPSPCQQCMKKHAGNYFVYFCGAKAYDPAQPELFPALNMEEPGHGSAVASPPALDAQPQALPPDAGKQDPPPLQGNAESGPEVPPGRAPLAASERPGELGAEGARDMGVYSREREDYRQPSGPAFETLVKSGDVVVTNYNTGPYVVEHVSSYVYCSARCYSLTLVDRNAPRRKGGTVFKSHKRSFINELVAVDGRIVKLFKGNSDEVFVQRKTVGQHPWGDGYACEKCGHVITDMLCPACFKEGFNKWVPKKTVSTPPVTLGARDIGEAPGAKLASRPQPSPANDDRGVLNRVIPTDNESAVQGNGEAGRSASIQPPSPEKPPPNRLFRVFNKKTHEWWEGVATHPGKALSLARFTHPDQCWIREKTGSGWITPHELRGAKSAAELMPTTTRSMPPGQSSPQPVVSQIAEDSQNGEPSDDMTKCHESSQGGDAKVRELIEAEKRRPDPYAEYKRMFPAPAARGRGRPKDKEAPRAGLP